MPLVGLVCHLTTRDSLFIENEYEIYSFAKLAIIIFSSVNQLGRFMYNWCHIHMFTCSVLLHLLLCQLCVIGDFNSKHLDNLNEL